MIETVLAENPALAPSLADTWLTLALCERDLPAAGRAVAALGNNPINVDAILLSPAFAQGLLAKVQGDAAAAQTLFLRARTEQEGKVKAQPDYAPALCVLGLIDAGLGHKEDALREGKRAMELLPISKDSVNGARMIEYFTITAAWAGDKDLAIQQVEFGIQNPTDLSYGLLKLHPYWDSLRGDPRFEKIVASLAPKDAAAPAK